MIGIFQALVALFIFALIITPIILLSILLIRTSRPKTNPQSAKRLDELAEIDAAIIEFNLLRKLKAAYIKTTLIDPTR